LLLVVCVAFAICVPPPARGDDTEAIAKAREALRQKMKELDAQQAGGAPATNAPVQPTAAAVKAVTPAPQPAAPAVKAAAPVAQPAAPAAQPAPTATAKVVEAPKPKPAPPTVKIVPSRTPAVASSGHFSDLPPASPSILTPKAVYMAFSPLPPASPNLAAATALKAKQDELDRLAANAGKTKPQPAAVATKPPSEKPALAAKPSTGEPVGPRKPSSETSIAAKAEKDRIAADAKAKQIAADIKAKQDRAAADKAAAAAKMARKPDRQLAFMPLTAPALPISMDKEQRLIELLQKYKAEAITPQQYHEARAKILSEP